MRLASPQWEDSEFGYESPSGRVQVLKYKLKSEGILCFIDQELCCVALVHNNNRCLLQFQSLKLNQSKLEVQF